MRRRRFLSGVSGIGFVSLSGCTTPVATGGQSDDSSDTGNRATAPVGKDGVPDDICESERSDDPGIYAIDEPATAADWSGIDPARRYSDKGGLESDAVVIGIERGGETRAYPLSIVWWHEIVNDDVGGPLIVTYCPLCRSGMVADRHVDGEPAQFEVTGQLWTPPELQTRSRELDNETFGVVRGDAEKVEVRNSGNLVLVDSVTGSFWSQLLAQAICGPKRRTRLETIPSTIATWNEWQERHPETDVLLPPPYSGTVE